MSSKGKTGAKHPYRTRVWGFAVLVLNVLLLYGAFIMYSSYNNAYKERLLEENLGNIANMNQSSAANITALFDSWDVKLEDIASYATLNDLTPDETLELISKTNTNEKWYIELIGSDYTGFLARQNADGSFPALSFTHSSYSLMQKVFDGAAEGDRSGVYFAPEYTDNGETALKFFAKYKYLSLRNEDGTVGSYTLLLATSAESLIDSLNSNTDFAGQTTVIIDASGNYILSNKEYKSINFFQFLYAYNDLSLDQKVAIQQEVKENGSGELYYKNAGIVVEDCVYRYDGMGSAGWYCITCVPCSSFRAPAFNTGFLVNAALFLLVLFAVDVIWLQRINKRLRESVEREREASAAKGNFMSRMSHEIRTPLNAIIGYNTIAQSEMTTVKDEAEQKQSQMKVLDCLTKSGVASKHLLTIINDVLDMSAIESGKITVGQDVFDFKGLITSLTTVFYSQAKSKGVSFKVVLGTLTEEWLVGDPMRVNQILTNLLSNAIKFTPDGGSVTLTINQTDNAGKSDVRFEVADTGIGMSKEYITHIWTPFEQADSSISRRFGGSGLGLSITKNLVDLMGGTISIESTQGKGSVFTVNLSFLKTAQHLPTDSYDFSAVNALVVDDDESTCDYIQLLFNRSGARCAAVTSGEDAIKAVSVAKERNDYFTVCLIDWQMPVMDGIETVRRIKEICGDNMPLIIISAYDYSDIADAAAKIGVTKFISKPLFQSSLFDVLANICGVQKQKSAERNKAYDFEGARIILAEDNAMNMEIAKTILESSGLVVDGAWNGSEAVEMFESSAPDTYTAILMDVHMPVMNGHEATRTIRASSHPQAKTIPIIAMTADAFAENVAQAKQAGMNDHISKPIDVSTLFSTLSKYI